MGQPGDHKEQRHAEYMRRAIALSAEGALVEKAGGCFGAVVVSAEGKIIGEGYNREPGGRCLGAAESAALPVPAPAPPPCAAHPDTPPLASL